jgi:hypothetical protein
VVVDVAAAGVDRAHRVVGKGRGCRHGVSVKIVAVFGMEACGPERGSERSVQHDECRQSSAQNSNSSSAIPALVPLTTGCRW